ncbi:MAG: DUF2384 domain-containing protein [Ekhidna sp.]|nr:DUF2384 domain-containing protein [Ekhidna sp.]
MAQVFESNVVAAIPDRVTDTQVLHLLHSEVMSKMQVQVFKNYTQLEDETLSDWLNISVKTFRNYKKTDTELKENIKERIILLISLFKHGKEVFGTTDQFISWMNIDNPFLDYSKPIDYLNTITGIRFINDRLTAMEYGDNV